jgi:hypothetical protein
LAASENWPATVIKLESMAVSYATDKAPQSMTSLPTGVLLVKHRATTTEDTSQHFARWNSIFEKHKSESCPLQTEQSTKAKTQIFHILTSNLEKVSLEKRTMLQFMFH